MGSDYLTYKWPLFETVPAKEGQTAGIDPKSGRIWFGDSILEIVEHRRTEDLDYPLFFERVDYAAYLWKGERR